MPETQEQKNSGFSLIELIIAIAVLAILSLPLLSYFSGAENYAARGKFLQAGEMAAQSVIEDLNAYETYEQIDAAVASGCAYTVDSPENLGVKYLRREMDVNGQKMIAKIKMDFNYDSTGSAVLYNDYEVPEISALYSDANAVAVEENQQDVAVSHFFAEKEGNTDRSVIAAGMTRTVNLSVLKNTNPEIYDVKVSYTYEYDGKSYTPSALLNTQMEAAEYKRMYLLYQPSHAGTQELFDITIDSGIAAEDVNEFGVYFICQGLATTETGKAINLICHERAGQAKYFSNGISIIGAASASDYISKEKKERISNITVDIYHENETVFDENTKVLTLQSAQ